MSNRNSDAPIFDAVVAERGWHPAEVGPTLDVGALVARSYDARPQPQEKRTRGAKPLPQRRNRNRQQRR